MSDTYWCPDIISQDWNECPRAPKKIARKLMWDEQEIKFSRWGLCPKCKWFSKDECFKTNKMCKSCFKQNDK